MGKCILLIRVSTQHQDLSQQTEKVKAEAIKDGFNEKNIIILEDKESAVKLSEEERNGLNKMKWYIEHENICCVYAYEISRISRQPSILYSIRDFLIKHNVQLIILNPYMKMLKDDGTLSETANIFFGIFSSMAENEGFIRKARMRRGIEKKKSLGLYVGSPVAVGYKVENDKLVIDEENAALVRRIFNDYINGTSIRLMARQLQAEGWRKKSAFLTVCQSILNILHREYYCGDASHPAIITHETFEKARHIAAHKNVYKRTNGPEALLKGKVYDKESGYLLSSNMANKQYYCKRYGHTTISMKSLDMLAAGIAREWHNVIYKLHKKEFEKIIKNEIKKQEKIISTMTDNITNNQDKIDRIVEKYIEGKLSKKKSDELEKKAFEELQYYKQLLSDAEIRLEELKTKLKNNDVKPDNIRDIIQDVIERIDVQRINRFVCEVIIKNKYTGEKRHYEYNTRTCDILKMKIINRPALHFKNI